ncbi:MAG: GAF domain-containing protein [Thermacetogeniaceae bacterium]
MHDRDQGNFQVFNDLVQMIFALMDTGDPVSARQEVCRLLQQAFGAEEVNLSFLEAPQDDASAGAIRRDGPDLIIRLQKENRVFGQCLIRGPQQLFSGAQLDLLAIVLSNLFDCVNKYSRISKQIYDLNTYITISNNIQKNLNLSEQLQWVIDQCMKAVNASAASVLLLTQDEQSLDFFAVEGEKSNVLSRFTMPADKGIAGFVLQEQKPVIINDCRSSPYFYDQVDNDTGFTTRNMIAAPLIADQQIIGVIEVLNKNDGLDFVKSDADLVLNIANEVSFAVRNARIFEYVVTTYCKILQGQSNCQGCKRPLSSWTPCPLCTFNYINANS